MTIDELIAYYQNLLIIQYKTLPRASATIGALATEIIADLIYTQVQDGFDVNTAIGDQLDILGVYVGARRFLANFSSTATYMAFPLYSNAGASSVVGFSSYSDVSAPVGYWRSYRTTDVPLTLSDGQMQLLIKYLIAIHFSDTSVSSIDLILQEFFGNYLILTDNRDMTITYTHTSSDPSQLFSIINYMGILPKPAGVGINIVIV